MKKKEMKRTARRAGKAPRRAARHQTAWAADGAGEVLRDTWHSARAALTTTEQEVGKQIGQLLKRNHIKARDAAGILRELGARARAERRRAMKDLEARLDTLQSRIKKERKVVGRTVSDAVTATLAGLNVPSRREVTELTKKVDQLGAKIDAFRTRTVHRARG